MFKLLGIIPLIVGLLFIVRGIYVVFNDEYEDLEKGYGNMSLGAFILAFYGILMYMLYITCSQIK